MIQKIEEIIKQVVGAKAKFLVTASEKSEFGHYSTNAAFLVGGNPAELAEKIKNAGGGLFEKIEVKGKFINFWISKEALLEGFKETLKFRGFRRGFWQKKQKINLEFISANPTGPLTMANGRGGFLGDVLANVLELAGNKVTREYYINDAGNQVKLLGESVLLALSGVEGGAAHYQGEYVKELAKKLESRIPNLEAEDVGRLASTELLREIKKSAENVAIKFDVWFSEYEKLRKGGEVKKILDLLEKKGMIEKKEGAVWLKTSDIADEKDRVLVKSDGQPTYFLTDLAYHYDKFIKRKFDLAIDIWGADHHGYVARLKSGVKALGIDPEKLKITITQLVRLVEGGKEVKMSKRAGEFVTLDELVEEVGKDAARFFFLMHSPDTHMDFDLALAKEKSQKNPVYYVQYAYVRCGSILAKASSKSETLNSKTETELTLVRELVKWPDVVRQTTEDYQVHRLTRYVSEIARAFHNFYEKERVIDEKGTIDGGKLALVSATRRILEKVFDTIGISKPDKM